MNEDTAFAAIACTAIIAIIFYFSFRQHDETSIKLEAMKAGLIQKIDPETKEPIWTKP